MKIIKKLLHVNNKNIFASKDNMKTMKLWITKPEKICLDTDEVLCLHNTSVMKWQTSLEIVEESQWNFPIDNYASESVKSYWTSWGIREVKRKTMWDFTSHPQTQSENDQDLGWIWRMWRCITPSVWIKTPRYFGKESGCTLWQWSWSHQITWKFHSLMDTRDS